MEFSETHLKLCLEEIRKQQLSEKQRTKLEKGIKLYDALKDTVGNKKTVKVKYIGDGNRFVNGEIYNAYARDLERLYYHGVVEILCKDGSYSYPIDLFELCKEEKEEKMTQKEFINLLRYNDFERNKDNKFIKGILCFYLYNHINLVCLLIDKVTIFDGSSYEDAIEFAKIKGIELKPLPKFRKHWKIKVDGKETGEVIYPDEVGKRNGMRIINTIKDFLLNPGIDIYDFEYNIITKDNSSYTYVGKECNFAYYRDEILHEAVWVGEE